MQELTLQGITAKLNVNQDVVLTIKLEEFLSYLSQAPQLHDGTVVAVCLRHLLPKGPQKQFTHATPKVYVSEQNSTGIACTKQVRSNGIYQECS